MGDREKAFINSVAAMMQRHTDRLWRPACDIYRTREGWVVKFDLAGVDPDDLTVSIEGCNLVVRGTRRDTTLSDGVSHYHMEITYSRFERSLSLPCDLTKADISTEYRNGLLLVKFLTAGKEPRCEGRRDTEE